MFCLSKTIMNLLKNEYVFSIVSKGLMIIIGLIESVLLARYLGAELRGELSYIYSMSITGQIILTFAMHTAYPFERKNHASTSIQNLVNEFMTHAIVLCAGYFVVCTTISFFIWSLNSSFSFILILLPILGLDEIISVVYLVEHPNSANLCFVIFHICQCIYLLIAYLWLPQRVFYGVFYYVLGCLIRIVYYSRRLSIHFDIRMFSIKRLLSFLSFGFFPMIALLLTTLNYRLDVIMIKQYKSVSLASIGIYSIGIGLSEKALLIPDTVKYVLISKLAKGKDETEVAKVMRICFLSSIISAIIIILLCRLVVDILYGCEYAGAETITAITVFGTIVMVFFKMISQYNIVHHKQHINVIFLAVAVFSNVLLNTIMIPKYGIVGAAIATIVGHFLSSLLFLFYFCRRSHIPVSKLVIIQKEDISLFRDFFCKTSSKT